ncbi:MULTISPECIES: hypothetical protein [unclassified Microcoleus]
MRIKKVAFGDNILKWHFEPIYFFHLALLAGGYGIGKTQISKEIFKLL